MSKSVLHGQGMSSGIAIGPLYFLDVLGTLPRFRVPRKKIAAEKKRLHRALAQAKEYWGRNLDRLSRFVAKEQICILESYLTVLQDPHLLKVCEEAIDRDGINAEWAVELSGQKLSIEVAQEDPTTSFKRKEDIQNAVTGLLNQFQKKEALSKRMQAHLKGSIVVAEGLSPEMVATLKRLNVAGFITELGGNNSHTMILARALCIPAVSGVANLCATVTPDVKVILNGFEGKIFITPSRQELKNHQRLLEKHQILEKLLLTDAEKPAWTEDKKRIRMEANIEFPEEAASLKKYGAEAIGLFRTESLFWNPAHLPSEKEQHRIYKRVLVQMRNRPVAFRTLDVSGDLWLGRVQANPALGLRGIRFSLSEVSLLETQLKALLRAGAERLLLPMVGSIEELDCFFFHLQKIKRELKRDGITPKKCAVGVVIEVPAAGLMIDMLADSVDFFAIGSNDLIQYTLAIDRTNEQLAHHYSYYHPAILKILFQIVQNSLKVKKPVYLCGELGGDPLFIPVLLGLGIRHFSMNPLSIPRAKKIIRSLSAKECAQWVQKLMRLPRASDIEKELEKIRLKLDMPWWGG